MTDPASILFDLRTLPASHSDPYKARNAHVGWSRPSGPAGRRSVYDDGKPTAMDAIRAALQGRSPNIDHLKPRSSPIPTAQSAPKEQAVSTPDPAEVFKSRDRPVPLAEVDQSAAGEPQVSPMSNIQTPMVNASRVAKAEEGDESEEMRYGDSFEDDADDGDAAGEHRDAAEPSIPVVSPMNPDDHEVMSSQTLVLRGLAAGRYGNSTAASSAAASTDVVNVDSSSGAAVQDAIAAAARQRQAGGTSPTPQQQWLHLQGADESIDVPLDPLAATMEGLPVPKRNVPIPAALAAAMQQSGTDEAIAAPASAGGSGAQQLTGSELILSGTSTGTGIDPEMNLNAVPDAVIADLVQQRVRAEMGKAEALFAARLGLEGQMREAGLASRNDANGAAYGSGGANRGLQLPITQRTGGSGTTTPRDAATAGASRGIAGTARGCTGDCEQTRKSMLAELNAVRQELALLHETLPEIEAVYSQAMLAAAVHSGHAAGGEPTRRSSDARGGHHRGSRDSHRGGNALRSSRERENSLTASSSGVHAFGATTSSRSGVINVHVVKDYESAPTPYPKPERVIVERRKVSEPPTLAIPANQVQPQQPAQADAPTSQTAAKAQIPAPAAHGALKPPMARTSVQSLDREPSVAYSDDFVPESTVGDSTIGSITHSSAKIPSAYHSNDMLPLGAGSTSLGKGLGPESAEFQPQFSSSAFGATYNTLVTESSPNFYGVEDSQESSATYGRGDSAESLNMPYHNALAAAAGLDSPPPAKSKPSIRRKSSDSPESPSPNKASSKLVRKSTKNANSGSGSMAKKKTTGAAPAAVSQGKSAAFMPSNVALPAFYGEMDDAVMVGE